MEKKRQMGLNIHIYFKTKLFFLLLRIWEQRLCYILYGIVHTTYMYYRFTIVGRRRGGSLRWHIGVAVTENIGPSASHISIGG